MDDLVDDNATYGKSYQTLRVLVEAPATVDTLTNNGCPYVRNVDPD